LRGGGRALKTATGIAVGHYADFVSLSTRDATCLTDDAILDAWIFTHSIRPDCVWANGKKVVSGGYHIHRDKIAAEFHAQPNRRGP
jgi:cytosine/adenosine deaminase-related metal-dependent hydrolase